MGDSLEQSKVHPCAGENCKIRISSYDPHKLCETCREGPCTIFVRCNDCYNLTDGQFKELESILKENKRKREAKAKKLPAVPTTTVNVPVTCNTPPPGV